MRPAGTARGATQAGRRDARPWAVRPASVALGLALAAGGAAAGQTVDDDGWRYAQPDYTLVFPRDHAAHPDHKIEWWYYTGNVRDGDGRRLGYQLTFFRVGVDRAPRNPSPWAVRDLYMAHLAVTDVDRGVHRVAERLNRAGVGWAGASVETLDVHNDGWRVRLDGTTHRLEATDDAGRLALSLALDASVPPVPHGADGFSQKGREPGNASHYYSLTRLPTTGRITVDGRVFEVTGLSWMDHEFGSSFLEPSQTGWDWFSIQLDDGTDLMVYTLRGRDGTADPQSSGTVVRADGLYRLRRDDYRLVPGRRWTSPASGAAYPVEWQLIVPSLGLALAAVAAVDAQELVTGQSTGVTYWEGAIDVRGTHRGAVVTGAGYLEMTGYAGAPLSEVLR